LCVCPSRHVATQRATSGLSDAAVYFGELLYCTNFCFIAFSQNSHVQTHLPVTLLQPQFITGHVTAATVHYSQQETPIYFDPREPCRLVASFGHFCGLAVPFLCPCCAFPVPFLCPCCALPVPLLCQQPYRQSHSRHLSVPPYYQLTITKSPNFIARSQ
jgi:hypothetical protein